MAQDVSYMRQLIRAFGTENTEKQQKTDGEGNGDNPSTSPPRFDLGK